MADGLPEGRLVAIRGRGRDAGGGPLRLEPGELLETLTVDGPLLAELPQGTRLRVGGTVVVEMTRATELAAGSPDAREPSGGLQEAPTGVSVEARVVAGGVIRVGDAVAIEAVRVPLEDALDLHPFRPDEIAAIVSEYLEQARDAGFEEVRIIHGRGGGVQRETVRRLLAASLIVSTFGDAPPERGGWGATIARLHTIPEGRPA